MLNNKDKWAAAEFQFPPFLFEGIMVHKAFSE